MSDHMGDNEISRDTFVCWGKPQKPIFIKLSVWGYSCLLKIHMSNIGNSDTVMLAFKQTCGGIM